LTLPVIIGPEAELDLAAAQLWHETERPGLGAEFRASVGQAIGLIGSHPDYVSGRSSWDAARLAWLVPKLQLANPVGKLQLPGESGERDVKQELHALRSQTGAGTSK
jgi:hypothetical protein